jgi:hypothetical protein
MLHVIMVYLPTFIYPKNHPNVGKYTIHGAYGYYINIFPVHSNHGLLAATMA